MIKLAVIDPGHEDIAGHIIAAMQEFGSAATDVSIYRFESLAALADLCPDVIVISAAAAGSAALSSAEQTSCGIVLLPGNALNERVNARCVVTYGMSPKNSITLSSINESSCVLAIQRELVTAQGDVLERQEIRIRGGIKPDSLLAVAGALLICGVKLPEINP